MKNVCIYGASSPDLDQLYPDAVYALGKALAQAGMGLVFGGGAQGLMGAAARGFHDFGGEILGVAPSFFNVDGILYQECTEFIYTETMRERKQIMEERSDAFIMAPGGIGTFEEFFEMLTLKQLRRHHKALLIYNVNGYYDKLLEMMDVAAEQKFMKEICKELYYVFTRPEEAVAYLQSYNPDQWKDTQLKNI